MIFRGGSGSGINLSNIRGSMEPLSKGGTASGPVSFMRGADAWAGTIKSGGKTRRAAKMVVLDVDHPDIQDFIWCKAQARRTRPPRCATPGSTCRSTATASTRSSTRTPTTRVRVTDEFMHAVEDDADWHLIARTDRRAGRRAGQRARADARDRRGGLALRRPGRPVRHDDQPVAHVPELGPDQRVQPVLGVHARRRLGVQPGVAEPDEVPPRRTARSTSSASSTPSTSCCSRRRSSSAPSSYPTEEIGRNARAFRQLGLGYANLGAFLMANGFPYDSDEGRGTAAAITALMTGRAYLQSARIAAAIGPYDRYAENREAHNNVMRMHRDASLRDPGLRVRRHARCWPPRARRGTRRSRSASSTATATRRRRCSRRRGRSRS